MIADQAPPAIVAVAPRASARVGQALRWRRDLDTPPAVSLRWTPDGKWLAFAPADAPGVVSFIDPATTGGAAFSLGSGGPAGLDPPRRTWDFALSPDGRRLALPASGGKVRLWDLARREVEREIEGTGEEVRSLAFDPSGRWLATGGFDYGLALWEAADGKLVLKHAQPSRQGAGQAQLAFSADRRWLVGAGADHELTLWRVPSIAFATAVDAHPSTSFATDGQLVAYRDRNGLRLWEPTSGSRQVAGPYWQLAVRPGGQQVLGRTEDGRLVLVDVKSRRARPTGLIFSKPSEAAFSPDGRTLAIARGSSRGIRLYDVGD